jgi:hypothetical protein
MPNDRLGAISVGASLRPTDFLIRRESRKKALSISTQRLHDCSF